MPYTFGGATTDDANFSIDINIAGASSSWLVMGWWYPTTLTAGRALWGLNDGIHGVTINSGDTSELTLKTNSTTDGEWSTTGVGLTVNQWKFLAFAGTSANVGNVGAYRAWMGTQESAPVEISLTTVVSPSGSTIGGGGPAIGNSTQSTSVAWQGDIAHFSILTAGGSSQTGILAGLRGGPSTFATWTQNEADDIWRFYVIPVWMGDYSPLRQSWKQTVNDDSKHFSPLSRRAVAWGPQIGAQVSNRPYKTVNYNGCTPSENGTPRTDPNFCFTTRRH